MSFEINLRFSEKEAASLESGAVRQPGWFRCVVHDVTEEEEKGFWLVHYRVTDGPWTGSEIKDRLFNPDLAADTDKAKSAIKRIGLVLKRLGVWDGAPGNKSVSLIDCIGRPCWLKLSERSYKGKDGEQVKTVDVEWAGVYPLDDKRVPEEVRNPGAAPASGGSARASARRQATQPSPDTALGRNYVPPPPPPDRPAQPDYSDL